LDLFWKQHFCYTGAQQNLWMMIPTLLERDSTQTKSATKKN
jgi:hypothetical protein